MLEKGGEGVEGALLCVYVQLLFYRLICAFKTIEVTTIRQEVWQILSQPRVDTCIYYSVHLRISSWENVTSIYPQTARWQSRPIQSNSCTTATSTTAFSSLTRIFGDS